MRASSNSKKEVLRFSGGRDGDEVVGGMESKDGRVESCDGRADRELGRPMPGR